MSLNIAARLSLDSSNYSKNVRAAQKATKGLKGELGGAGRAGKTAGSGFGSGARGADRLTRAEKRLAKQSRSTAKSLMSIKNVVTGIAFGLAANDFTKTIFEYEKFKAQLETTFKGVEEDSQRAFKAVEQFAKETPFTLDQSLNAFIKLRNLGIVPTKELMLSMGNTASAMGKDMNQFMEAIADAGTGEFERLKEFGIKSRSEGNKVSFTFQGVTTTVGKTQKEIVGYLQSIGENQFAGSMERQMEGLPGVFSNLQVGVNSLWRTLGDAGATNFATKAIKGVSIQVDSLTEMISTGYLGESLQIQFAGWIDAGEEVKAYLSTFVGWMGDEVFDPLFELLTGKEINPEESGFMQWLEFIKESFLNLPENLSAVFTIIIGEADKLRLSVIEQFELLAISADETWLNIEKFGTDALDALELAAAISIDFIIERFADLVGGMGDVLKGMPDAVVPDSWIEGINSAEAAVRGYADSEAAVRAEIEANQAVYDTELTSINDRRSATQTYYDEKRAAADSAISQALQERDATLAAKDVLLQQAQANHEAAKGAALSAEEHNELANKYMAAGVAANDAGDKAVEASEKTIKAAAASLAAVIKNTETEREKVEQWYRDSVDSLTEAEKLKLDSTKSYAELRGRVDQEYYKRLSDLDDKRNTEWGDSLRQQLDGAGIFGQTLGVLYDEWGGDWTDLLNSNSDQFGLSMDSILDSWKNLLIQMVASWALSGIAGLLNGDGFSGFNSDAFFGNSGSSNGGLFGGSRNQAVGTNSSGQPIDASGNVVSNGIGDYASLASGVYGVYGGVKQGGTEGYTNALISGVGLYNQAVRMGLIESGAFTELFSGWFSSSTAAPSLTTGISNATTWAGSGSSYTVGTANEAALAAEGSGGLAAGYSATAGWITAGLLVDEYLNNGRVANAFVGEYKQRTNDIKNFDVKLGWDLKPGYDAILATFAGRGPKQILLDEMQQQLGNDDEGFSALGANGEIGFDGGNTGVFGANFGISGTGLTSQQFTDQAQFFNGAQSSLDGLKAIADDAGFTTNMEDGALKVLGATEEQMLAMWQTYADGLTEAVAYSEVFDTAIENYLIQPTNLLFENLALGFGQTAFEARDSIVQIDAAVDEMVENGMSGTEALFTAISEHYEIAIEDAELFVAASGVSAERWVQNFSDASGDVLSEMLNFNEQGLTSFETLADGTASAFSNAAQIASDEVAAMTADILANIAAANDGIDGIGRSGGGGGGGGVNIEVGAGKTIQSYEIGTPRLQSDGLVYAHKDEAIIDPQATRYLQKYGIQVKAGGLNVGLEKSISTMIGRIDSLVVALERKTSAEMKTGRAIKQRTQLENQG